MPDGPSYQPTAAPQDPSPLTTAQLLRELANFKAWVDVQIDSTAEKTNALAKRLEDRLKAMDTAMIVFTDNLTRVPTAVDRAVGALQNLHDERFNTVNLQFNERDARMNQTNLDNKVAITAALAAAKEAAAAIDEKTAHLQALHDEKFRSIAVQFSERDTRTEQTSRDSKVAVDAALQAAKEAVGEQNRSSALAIAKSEAATAKSIDQLQVILQTATSAIDDKISDIKERLTIIEAKRVGQDTEHTAHAGAQTQWLGVVGGLVGAAGLGLAILVAATRDAPNTPAPIVIERPAAPAAPAAIAPPGTPQ
jgi:hypothetical protein